MDDYDTFNALMRRYGVIDLVFIDREFGLTRYREYSDGGWLQGYRVEPVLYWGA
jgi:hypothetical protein